MFLGNEKLLAAQPLHFKKLSFIAIVFFYIKTFLSISLKQI